MMMMTLVDAFQLTFSFDLFCKLEFLSTHTLKKIAHTILTCLESLCLSS